MKSGKQRRVEIIEKRKKRAAKRGRSSDAAPSESAAYRMVPVNEKLLAPNNSYGAPDFVRRGHYVDIAFRCADCGSAEIWTGAQQKWWYEIAKGFVYSSAVRCRACRRKQREQRDAARLIHLRGLAKKKQRLAKRGETSS